MKSSTLDVRYNNLVRNVFLEEKVLVIEEALLTLAGDSAVRAEAPDIHPRMEEYLTARDSGDVESRECSLIELYLRLHGAGTSYSPGEQQTLERRRGITAHAGGLAPLILAEAFITDETTAADLGAGNGLQGLLLQRIRPHRRTIQVELSSEMIRVGRLFQQVLGIGQDAVEWVHDDIARAPLKNIDFLYLFRPARPFGEGNELYRAISSRLARARGPMVIMSVADCLGKFLGRGVELLYQNEQVSIFRKPEREAS
jgi:hypothetical protein